MLNSSWFQENDLSASSLLFACLRFCGIVFGLGSASFEFCMAQVWFFVFIFSYSQIPSKIDKQGFKRFQRHKEYVCPPRIVPDISGFPDNTLPIALFLW